MIRVSYEECKEIWDNKRTKVIKGQQDYITYASKKLGIVKNKHEELRSYYNRYMRENK